MWKHIFVLALVVLSQFLDDFFQTVSEERFELFKEFGFINIKFFVRRDNHVPLRFVLIVVQAKIFFDYNIINPTTTYRRQIVFFKHFIICILNNSNLVINLLIIVPKHHFIITKLIIFMK